MSNENNGPQSQFSSTAISFIQRAITTVEHIPLSIVVSRTWDSERIAKEASRSNISR